MVSGSRLPLVIRVRVFGALMSRVVILRGLSRRRLLIVRGRRRTMGRLPVTITVRTSFVLSTVLLNLVVRRRLLRICL